ncbi:uncharacterized protein LOC134689857 [Mytilus trossulus]|uniref:uncharacterized protein LOC134689857 n=1 Tax=Mytilus trossulus TaxID=6551 RepID=UPI00300785D4
MDSSDSIQKAQNPAVCQFCDFSSDIKWKCINCDLFLCELCTNKIHSRIKGLSDKHVIINIKDIGTQEAAETIRKGNIRNIVCSVHLNEPCFGYCDDCSLPVCFECSIENHKDHSLAKLNVSYQTKLDQALEINTIADNAHSKVLAQISKLENIVISGNSKYEKTKQDILSRENFLKKVVEQKSHNLLQELDKTWKPAEQNINSEYERLKSIAIDLEKSRNTTKEALESQDATSAMLKFASTIKLQIPDVSDDATTTKYMEFKRNDDVIDVLTESFGKLVSMDFVPLKTFTLDLPTTSLVKMNSESFFVNSRSGRVLKQIQINDQDSDFQKLETDLLVDIKVYSFDIMEENIFYISVFDDTKVMITTPNTEEMKTFVDLSPFVPRGIRITKDNEIMVGMRTPGKLNAEPKLNSDILGKIAIFNSMGQENISFQIDETFKLTSPSVILDNTDNSICLIDLKSSFSGRIVNFKRTGDLNWTYTGCPVLNISLNPFYPSDMVSSNSGLIVIVDTCKLSSVDVHKMSALHVLTPEGGLLLTKLAVDIGIMNIMQCAVFDKNENLWIGCWGPNAKHNFHMIKFVH